MGRQRNVVVKTVLDLTSVESVRDFATRLGLMRNDIRQLQESLADMLGYNLEVYYIQPMLWTLQKYPPRKPGMKIRWTSRKQQKFVMAKLRFLAKKRGDNEVWHHRTGGLGANWVAEVVRKRGKVTIRVYNRWKGMRFVQGNIGLGKSARSAGRYAQPIQRFHTDRGWQPAAPTIQKGYQKAEEYAAAEIGKRLERAQGRIK